MLFTKNAPNLHLRFIMPVWLFVVFAFPAMAAHAHEPEVIGAAQTASMLTQENVVLIDNRPPVMFEAGHLPNALSMTYFKPGSPQNQMNRDMLTPYKGKTLIFYCSGRNRAYHAAMKAIEWDISPHIFWFKGGWNDWQDHLERIK